MEGKITAKTKRGKEAFELYIQNEGDQSTFTYLTKKYGLSVSTIRGDIYHYMNRVVSPKPSNEEINLYKEIVRKNQFNLGKKNAAFLYEKAAETRANNYNEALINELLDIKYVSDLITYLVNSESPVSEVQKEIDKALNINTSEEFSKLDNIKNIIDKNHLVINENRRLKSRNKISASNKENYIRQVTSILEEMLIEGFDKLDSIIIKSNINRYTFDKCLPLLANGNEEQQLLHTQYYNELAKDDKLLEENYLNMTYYLENGIEKNGIKTYYNILDYFRMTKVNPVLFQRKGYKLMKDNVITRTQYNLVCTFFERYDTSIRVLSYDEARDLYYSLSDEVISIEDKENIINYLENEVGIKLYTGVFLAACEEVLRGTLTFKKLARE